MVQRVRQGDDVASSVEFPLLVLWLKANGYGQASKVFPKDTIFIGIVNSESCAIAALVL